jgi:hypothetical protein
MYSDFKFVLQNLFRVTGLERSFTRFNADPHYHTSIGDQDQTYRALNLAFLLSLVGQDVPGPKEAMAFLRRMANFPGWEEVALFYLKGIGLIQAEIDSIGEQDTQVARRLTSLVTRIEGQENEAQPFITAEGFWSFFHPELMSC